MPPPVNALAAIASAYRQHRPHDFNQAVAAYQSLLPRTSSALKKGRAEFFYNDTKAFLHAMIIYLCAFILAATCCSPSRPSPISRSRCAARHSISSSSPAWSTPLAWSSAWCSKAVRQSRIFTPRPFLSAGARWSSAWCWKIYRVGLGCVMASLVGFVTLVIAHNLALGGDTMEMMRAVLDTNFWLATHVVMVTLGYASTFAAGLLAILYILLGLFTLAQPESRPGARALRPPRCQRNAARPDSGAKTHPASPAVPNRQGMAAMQPAAVAQSKGENRESVQARWAMP